MRYRITSALAFLPALLALLALVGITAGFVVPTVRRVQAVRAATIAEREQLEQRYQRGRERSRATLALREREQILSAISNRVPSEHEALTVIRSIEAVAASHHLEERIAIDWSTARTVGHIIDVPTTIELSGDYPNLIAALRDLERMTFPLAIEQFDITTGTRAGFVQPGPRSRVQLIIHTSTLWNSEGR